MIGKEGSWCKDDAENSKGYVGNIGEGVTGQKARTDGEFNWFVIKQINISRVVKCSFVVDSPG
jgi:hypothetical protein